MRGALITRTSDLTGVSWPLLPVPFEQAVYDTDSFFAPAAPGRFTIPAGVAFVELLGGVELPASASAGTLFVQVYKNGDVIYAGLTAMRNGTAGHPENVAMAKTPPLPVVAGDYFELRANVSGLGNPTSVLAGNRTFFSILALA